MLDYILSPYLIISTKIYGVTSAKVKPQSKNLFHWSVSYSFPAVMPNSSASDCGKEMFNGFRRL
jgi:hypothetical protein